jgi:hypothetical protein
MTGKPQNTVGQRRAETGDRRINPIQAASKGSSGPAPAFGASGRALDAVRVVGA